MLFKVTPQYIMTTQVMRFGELYLAQPRWEPPVHGWVTADYVEDADGNTIGYDGLPQSKMASKLQVAGYLCRYSLLVVYDGV